MVDQGLWQRGGECPHSLQSCEGEHQCRCIIPQPCQPATQGGSRQWCTGVAVVVNTDTTIEELLAAPPDSPARAIDLAEEQHKDREILEIIAFLESGSLPEDEQKARKIVVQEPYFALVDDILYFLDSRHGDRNRVAVPKHLCQGILEENHSGPMAGHFSGKRLYKSLLHHWWWPGMYTDTVNHCTSCRHSVGLRLCE